MMQHEEQTFAALTHPLQVDLSRHALIEASAGTGKTFTIERLVVRGVVEKQLPLSRILAVTFTEKATGELKDRIRRYLESILRSGNDESGEGLLDAADRDWFRLQIASQGDSLFRRIGEAVDRFDEAAIFTIHGFCQSVLREYGFDLGRMLQYEIVDDGQILEELIQDRYRHWPSELGSRLESILVAGEFWKREGGSGPETIYRWDELLKRLVLQAGDSGELRVPGTHDEYGPMALLRDTVIRLREDLRRHKQERGWISYDDMIRLVRVSVTGVTGDVLARSLRERFRLAVVDEFQDTDGAQWDIFRSIFLGPGDSRLVLVGDPKQAIYSFRGADIHTYLQARHLMQELHAEGRAALYRLELNFRSKPEYVQATNRLFAQPSWMWSANANAAEVERIAFHSCKSAGTWAGTDLPSGRKWMNLWTCDPPGREGETSARDASRKFARFVGQEIRRLKKSGWLLTPAGQAARPFDLGDAAVLVVSGREAALVMRELKDAGIPATHYKQAGVFRSKEAFEILYLLEAIADPARRSAVQKALLTRFFGFELSRIHDVDELPVDDPVRLRFQEWQELASQALWSRLFRSFITHPDSAIRRQVESDASGWERTLTNYEQILQILEEEALRRAHDITGIIRSLTAKIRDPGGLAEEETLHRQETEEKRVRVLTMHASKGLEFPVVFVAGGFTARKSNAWRMFYEGDRRVFGILPSDENDRKTSEVAEWTRLHGERASEEDARLFYVALTRAGLLSYIPFHRPARMQGSGVLCRFVYDALGESLGDLPADGRDWIGRIAHGDEDSSEPASDEPQIPILVQEDFPVVSMPENLRERKADLHSYSSLSAHQAVDLRLGEEEAEHDDATPELLTAERSAVSLSPNLDRIFRGAGAGNCFHEILERLDYQDAAFRNGAPAGAFLSLSDHNRRLIRYRLRMYGYGGLESTSAVSIEEEEAASLIFRVMTTELLPGFCLRDLDTGSRIHEMEFFLSANSAGGEGLGEDFITGFVDLVFQHGGRTYILDWKTNLLDDYSRPSLERAMRSMQYDLQFSLYAKAVSGWLSASRPGTQVDGVFYLFLRGMQPQSENGIYFVRPAYEDVERSVAEALG